MSTIKELKEILKETGVIAPDRATKTELEAIVALIQEPEVVVDVEVEHPIIATEIISTEVDLTRPNEISLDKPAESLPSADRWQQMERISERIASSSLVTPALRNKPEDILLVLLAANDLGIPATQALSKLHIVDGKLSMAAEMMVALVLRDGHELWGDEANGAQTATCYGRRRNSEEVTKVIYTIEDAKLAGLEQRTPWKKYPKSMLWARAVSMLCRQVFPDSVAGVSYTPDELEISDSEESEKGLPAIVNRAGSALEADNIREGKALLSSDIDQLKQKSPSDLEKLKTRWREAGLVPLKSIQTEKQLNTAIALIEEVLLEQAF
jgi:hypothetical protein